MGSRKLRRVRSCVHSLNMGEGQRCVETDLCLYGQTLLLRLLKVVRGASAVKVCLWGRKFVAAVCCHNGPKLLVVIECRDLRQCEWRSVV